MKIIEMDMMPLLHEGLRSILYYTTFFFTQSAGEPDKGVQFMGAEVGKPFTSSLVVF
jgi:hypothetical protein